MKHAMYYFSDLVREHPYYNFSTYSVKRPDGKLAHGYLYTLCGPLDDDEKSRLLAFDNVALFVSTMRYAPEQSHPVIFIAASPFRAKKETTNA